MSNELPPEQTPDYPAPEIEADAQAARLLTERLNEITTRSTRSAAWYRAGYTASMLYFLLCVFVMPVLFGRINPAYISTVFLFTMIGFIGIALLMLVSVRKAPRFNAAEITHLGGTQAIPALLAGLLAYTPPPQRKAMRDALTLLLPQMKASDAYLLTPASRQMIRGLLIGVPIDKQKYQCEDALRIATLKALEQVGDAKDIPVVEKLITRSAKTPSEKLVRQAAMECLPTLLINCGDVEAARVLLRASQAEAAHSASLLRPASGLGQTDSAELLRGAEPPEEEGDRV